MILPLSQEQQEQEKQPPTKTLNLKVEFNTEDPSLVLDCLPFRDPPFSEVVFIIRDVFIYGCPHFKTRLCFGIV